MWADHRCGASQPGKCGVASGSRRPPGKTECKIASRQNGIQFFVEDMVFEKNVVAFFVQAYQCFSGLFVKIEMEGEHAFHTPLSVCSKINNHGCGIENSLSRIGEELFLPPGKNVAMHNIFPAVKALLFFEMACHLQKRKTFESIKYEKRRDSFVGH